MSDKIDPWFREWLIKQKLKHSISARFLIRFHVVLILVGLQAWIRYSGIRAYVNSRRAKELLEPDGFRPADRWGRSEGIPLDAPVVPDEGCLLLVGFLLLLLLAFAMGGYLIVFAADMMAELVFELLLAAGLVRGIRRVDLLADFGIPRITLWALAVALMASFLFGLFARNAYPQATTIGEVIREVKG